MNIRFLRQSPVKVRDKYEYLFPLSHSFNCYCSDCICMGSSQKNTKIILFINMQVSSLNNPIIPFRCHIKKTGKDRKRYIPAVSWAWSVRQLGVVDYYNSPYHNRMNSVHDLFLLTDRHKHLLYRLWQIDSYVCLLLNMNTKS